jgi:DNA/RNA endonuclease G (NUC1)
MKTFIFLIIAISVSLAAQIIKPPSGRYKPIILDTTYKHDKWDTQPKDKIYEFAAFTSSFDTKDDNDGDGDPDIWGIPEWVSYEIKKKTGSYPQRYDRPRPWLTDSALARMGIAPYDSSYHVPGASNRQNEIGVNHRFVRGHMCPKKTADGISMGAGYNTHTILNSVPQMQFQNNGIWKVIEFNERDWAKKYGRIWVITGPVFFQKNPAMWLGQDGETKVAIPDALFKIIIREDSESLSGIKSISFVIPNIYFDSEHTTTDHVRSINRIQELTGLTFLNSLTNSKRDYELKRNESFNKKIIKKF